MAAEMRPAAVPGSRSHVGFNEAAANGRGNGPAGRGPWFGAPSLQ